MAFHLCTFTLCIYHLPLILAPNNTSKDFASFFIFLGRGRHTSSCRAEVEANSEAEMEVEVIKNGNKVLKKTVGNVKQEYEPTTAEEKLDRKNEMKARGTLLMALPNKDQLNQLEIQGEVIKQEDMNLKLLRSLPSEWKTHALIWRNKVEIETISLDDFTNSTNNTNKADNTAYEVSTAHTQGNTINSTTGDNLCDAMIYAFLISQPNSPQLAQEDLEQLHPDELEEMDLQWEMPMLTIKARRFIKRTGRKLDINGQRVRFDSYQSEEEHPINFALMAYTSSGSSSSSDSDVDSCSKSCVKAYATLKEQYDSLSLDYKKSQFNLVSYKVGLGYNATTPAVESFVNSSEVLDKSISDKGYHAVPPLLIGTFMAPKPDLMFIVEQVESESLDVVSNVTSSDVKTVESKLESVTKGVFNTIKSNAVRMNNFSAPIIEDWNSDDESEVEPNDKVKTVRPSTEKRKTVNTAREIVEMKETPKQSKHYPRGNQRNWNNLMSLSLGSDFKMINKACFVYGSFEHLHYVCDKKVVRPVWNNTSKVNHKNFANKMTHSHPKRRFVPQAVLTRFGKLSTAGAKVNTVRPVNTANTKAVNTVTRSFNKYSSNKNSIFNKKVNTVSVNDTTARERAVGNPQQKEYKEKEVIDSGCSRHMTRNKCYLDEYEDYDGGFVSFGDGKGRISRKGIKREFSVAKTPQQNGVTERKNRILIEAARTMLVDSKLPTTFWAEAVNTACYVLNRVLIIKPHNKTPYELIHGRPSLIEFMKPFGCPVTILNTRDHLGKFDGKANEGFFVRYFVVSKAMRVFNKRTRIVEETLNIRILENVPNVKGNGPDCLFDVDSLTISMNYVPVVAGNQTNGIAGTKDNIVTDPNDSEENARKKPTEVDESGASDNDGQNDQATRSDTTRPSFTDNVPSTPVNTAGPSVSTDNAFKEHPFQRFSPFKNASSLLHVPNVSPMHDTKIFGNAYDNEDVEEEVDMNNVASSYTALDAPFTKFLKDHP
ncbi:ribonuclease H-like domain-containing protein [Tanacetum coccineum]